MPHIEPDEGEEFIPKLREPQKRKRKRKRDSPNRLSPSQRKVARWVTVIVPAESYAKLREIAEYRGTSLSQTVSNLIEPEFDKVYEESVLLMRIEERRLKEEIELEEKRRNLATRRTSF